LLAVVPLGGVHAQGARTLLFAQSVPVTALDPAGASIYLVYPAGYEAAFLIYDGLVRFDGQMKIVPELARSWSVSADGRMWTFKLRTGVTFQDGTPLSARLVAADLQRQANPQTNQSNRPLWDPVSSVTAPDDQTVLITTKAAFGALLNTVAHGSALIASPQAITQWGAEYKLHPLGTGPYKVDRWDVGTELALVRNPAYWGPKPGFDRMVLSNVPDATTRVAMLQSGQAQVAEAIPPENVAELSRVPSVQMIVKPALRTFGMGMNLNHPPLDDPKVRLALNYAVNKDAIVRAIFHGQATALTSPIAPQTVGATAVGAYPFDPAKARSLLAEAGWTPGPQKIAMKNGRPLHLTLLTPDGAYPHDVEVTETVADYLRNVGVDATIEKVEPAVFWDHLLIPPGQLTWDLVLFGFNPSNGDGGYHLDSLFHSNPDRLHRPWVWNFTWYTNAQVDGWLTDGAHAVDPRVRAQFYGNVQRRVWSDAPYLWLYGEDVIVGASRSVKNVEVLPIIFTVLKFAQP